MDDLNYSTWCVKLWIDNDEASYHYWKFMTELAKGDVTLLADQLREEYEESSPDLGCSLYADLLFHALSQTDWYEIAKMLIQEHS